uniref:Putative ovule protein n=1 Tax=Solanum chacoense TaxID=4108 RepID=A0A0V0HAN1_SOLCH
MTSNLVKYNVFIGSYETNRNNISRQVNGTTPGPLRGKCVMYGLGARHSFKLFRIQKAWFKWRRVKGRNMILLVYNS